MFVYRHFGRWGFGIGIVPFLLIVLPLMIVWTLLKAVTLALGEIVVVAYRVIAWAWRRGHPKHGPEPAGGGAGLPDDGSG